MMRNCVTPVPSPYLTGVPEHGVKDTHVYIPDISVCPVTGPKISGAFPLSPSTFPIYGSAKKEGKRGDLHSSKRFPTPLILAASCEVACPGRPITQFLGCGSPLQCITTPSRQDSA
ncbi:hypothetical protein F2Q70_00029261 [Brassica cretica]|uniref:Uncharacterized protein n=1 Tax=Brassica cretica TaxID=69181 RepID=A0A8S9FIS1_BRACR|nr:hypothetical protein F2Q70_00029261 [Brassica cretica]